MSPAYLSQKLTRPLPTKDRGTLRTILEARAYMLALPKQRETRTQWQRAAELLLGEASVADFSKAVEPALFFDAKLDVRAMGYGGFLDRGKSRVASFDMAKRQVSLPVTNLAPAENSPCRKKLFMRLNNTRQSPTASIALGNISICAEFCYFEC